MADRASIDAETVKARLTDPRGVLLSLGIPSSSLINKHGPCPACGGRDRYRYDNRHGQGDFFCNGCGAGDLFDLLMRVHGWGFPETLERVAEVLGIQADRKVGFYHTAQAPLPTGKSGERSPKSEPELSDRSDKTERALQIWRQAQPIHETPAETYLRGRGLTLPDCCEDLRYHPACPYGTETVPAMIALMTDVRTAEPRAIHRTPLKPDGTRDRERGKRMLGPSRQTVIRISPDDEVTLGVGLGEGIETCLAILQSGWAPIWAAGSAGAIRTFPTLPGVECLTIFSDADDAGIGAARECAARWAEEGREAQIISPRSAGADWADMKGAA